MEYWKVQQVLAKRFVCYVQHLRGGNPLLQTCSYRAKYASVIQEQDLPNLKNQLKTSYRMPQ